MVAEAVARLELTAELQCCQRNCEADAGVDGGGDEELRPQAVAHDDGAGHRQRVGDAKNGEQQPQDVRDAEQRGGS
jgi:hypothetical protein